MDTALGSYVNKINGYLDCNVLGSHKLDLGEDRPEILVINDGQDSAKTKQLPVKTNVIALHDGINNEVKDLCIATKGKYVFIGSEQKVQQFE